ncbi:MAG: DUF4271 domain-containing protein [Lentimicrobiaceae bacterium]|jgi:hypothetical protein|nr:DUF4271 domain-containing protein [Lentimicrobiaceae bacterium]
MERLFEVTDTIYRIEDAIFTLQKDTLSNQNTFPKIESLITESKATQIKEQIRVNAKSVPDWGLWLILSAVLLLAIGKSVYPRKLRLFFRAALGVSYMNLLLREWNPAKNAVGFCCFLFYSLLQTLFFALLISYCLKGNASGLTIQNFYFIYLVALVIYTFRFMMNRLLPWLFRSADATLRYRTLTLSVSTITAALLIPLMLMMMYNPSRIFFFIGSGFVVAMFVFKILESFFEIASTASFSRFYIFLYLCSLEIVPVLLALKVVIVHLLPDTAIN